MYILNFNRFVIFDIFQASTGDVQGKQPSMINFVDRAKYDSWAELKGLTNSDAQKKYVELVEGLIAEEKGET